MLLTSIFVIFLTTTDEVFISILSLDDDEAIIKFILDQII